MDFLLSLPSSVTDFLLSFPSAVTDFLLSLSVSIIDTCLIIRFGLVAFLRKARPQQPQISKNPKMTEKPMAAPTPLLMGSVVLT